MSKSLKNTVDPMAIMTQFGADATRWYFYSAVSVGNEYRFDPSAVQDVVRDFLLILWNVYKFFIDYARIDGFEPSQAALPVEQRATLDRWLLAELAVVIEDVSRSLENYDPTAASRRLEEFTVSELSKWYVRRSRRRFWKSESDADKKSAYQTLHQVLVSLSQLLAPFMPFLSEAMYRNLTQKSGAESVHLSDWPKVEETWKDDELRREMTRLRRLVETALAARNAAKIEVRQPLRKLTIADQPLKPELEAILLDELNIKQAVYRGEGGSVTLDTEVTDDLKLEGLARHLVRKIQDLRKQSGFAIEDRIKLFYDGDGILAQALERWRDYVATETLAVAVTNSAPPEAASSETVKIQGHQIRVGVERVWS
jgi:isoleucyl-tRNA synthetase